MSSHIKHNIKRILCIYSCFLVLYMPSLYAKVSVLFSALYAKVSFICKSARRAATGRAPRKCTSAAVGRPRRVMVRSCSVGPGPSQNPRTLDYPGQIRYNISTLCTAHNPSNCETPTLKTLSKIKCNTERGGGGRTESTTERTLCPASNTASASVACGGLRIKQ